MIRTLYMHHVSDVGNKALLAHLKRYNMEHGLPVAPEMRRLSLVEAGNQFNNFNAGKIQLYLQGLGGIKVSNSNDSLTFAPSLPTNWTFMEYRVPVMRRLDSDTDGGATTTWVKARVERSRASGGAAATATTKVSVENNPFSNLMVAPWAEGATVTSSSPPGASPSMTSGSLDGHQRWTFTGQAANTTAVELVLDYNGREVVDGGSKFDGRWVWGGGGREMEREEGSRANYTQRTNLLPTKQTTASRAKASRANTAPTTRSACSRASSTGASHRARGRAEEMLFGSPVHYSTNVRRCLLLYSSRRA